MIEVVGFPHKYRFDLCVNGLVTTLVEFVMDTKGVVYDAESENDEVREFLYEHMVEWADVPFEHVNKWFRTVAALEAEEWL